ncbi:MAG TPA: cyclic nucleotide-binding domain-containing protein [Candidatus Ozemobacteraceae bacterium]|nr:cyclic nucleotide-binding domain-containing protein [Candidatus Ozemobacteraceae bacterium]HQG27872.1 cyclic nucleotide-binding domain-containing protein [Candidatus Ozemobacteraceae bacterium]
MLENVTLFSELSAEEVKELESMICREEVRRGDVIFQEGDATRDLFIVHSGEVEISVRDLAGTPKLISTFGENEFFGEMSLLDRKATRSATARATRNTVLLKLPAARLEPLLDAQTPLSRSIHGKILHALSRRLRDITQRAAGLIKAPEAALGRIVSIVSARSGCGKTTLATNLAYLLARETGKRVLFIDLDRHYGDGSFLMGGYSQKSVATLCRALRGASLSTEELMMHFTPLVERLWILPALSNILEAEEMRVEDLVGMVHTCQKLFDYLILDTDEGLSETVLNAMEIAERTIFLLDSRDILSVKNTVRFFQALSGLRFPENKITVISNKAREDYRPETVPTTRFRISGILPEVQDSSRQEGKTLYQVNPQHRFCEAVRNLVRTLLQETASVAAPAAGFLNRLAAPQPMGSGTSAVPAVPDSGKNNGTSIDSIQRETISGLIHGIKLLLEKGLLTEAEAEARQLLHFCRDSSELYQVLGEILLCRGVAEEALLVLRKAAETDPSNGMAIGLVGSITGEKNLILKGIGLLQERLKGCPNFPDLINDLGRLHFFAGQFAEAKKAFRQALDINPNFREGRINLAIACGEDGNPTGGLEVLAPLQDRGVRGHYLAGCFHQLLGNFPEAFSEFKKAAAHLAEYHDLQDRLESMSAYFRKLENLVEMHRRYLDRHPGFPDLHVRLADLFVQMGETENAICSLKEALRLKPDYPEAKAKLSRLTAPPASAKPGLTAVDSSKNRPGKHSEPFQKGAAGIR